MQKINRKNSSPVTTAGGVEVTFYTDPLCCWSWAMGPAWEQLRSEGEEGMKIQYKMGGLLPSWRHFEDTRHAISRPSQMGPEWMYAASISGVPINSHIWVTDPPASSYPACIAVKCAQLQSEDFVEAFLHLLRNAVMREGKNIAKIGVVLDTARLFHERFSQFDLLRFTDDLMGEAGNEAFRKDLLEAKYLGIKLFPTLVIKRSDRPAVMLTGYQTYESLKSGIAMRQD
jgi:protein-disulfide isomerase-like protein with CxxC motif